MMPIRDLLSLILSLLLVAALPVSSRAQAVYGSVFGTVTDPQGARVIGAVVTVTDLTKNLTTTAQTNESGNYTVTHLIPCRYQVKVEQQGYKIAIQQVEVKADVAAHTDFALEIGLVTEQPGDGGLLNLDTGELFVGGVGEVNSRFNVKPTYKTLAPRLGITHFGYGLFVNQCNCPLNQEEHQYHRGVKIVKHTCAWTSR